VTSSYDIAISGDLKDTDPGAGEGEGDDMARLIGAQRMVLQAILDLPKDTAGYVKDTQIAQNTQIAISDVRDWIETLEGEGHVEVAKIEFGLSASITAQGKLILRQFQPIGTTPPSASKTSPPTPQPGGSSGHQPAAHSAPHPAADLEASPGKSGENISPASNSGPSSPRTQTTGPISLFYSYSHEDEPLRDQLAKHLSLLKRQGVIAAWHDRMIGAGDEWKGEIDKNLEEAQVILLLISPSFLASDYCYDIEMKRAIERNEAGAARVIPVILRSVDWQGSPFARLQVLPKDGKPVTLWPDRDEAFTDVAKGIRRAVEAMTANPR
jgi:hypothetical protein